MEKKKKTTQVKKTSTKKNTAKVQTKKNNTKKSKKAFTLIELLAVIIILGVLMIIAIPSVTRYIQDSRKSAYITTAHNFIDSARVMANSGELSMYDPNTTYYIPKDCISLEKGGDSPFGEFTDAYVVVTYNGKGYDYYWTSNDVTHNGIYLTYEGLLDTDSVMSDVEGISPNIGVGDRENIIVFDEGTCNTVKTEGTASDYVEEQGKITELGIDYENADYSNYLKTAGNSETTYFGYSLNKSKIEKISVAKTKTVPSDTLALDGIPTTGVDVSNKKNGSIMMWVTDKDSNGMYELFIGQDGGVVANSDSRYLFAYFHNAVTINVSYLNTKNVTNMSYMFVGKNDSFGGGVPSNLSKSMKVENIIGIEKLNTSNVTSMMEMFYDCYKLTSLNLNNWDVRKVTNMSHMFMGCTNLYDLKVNRWKTDNLNDISSAFIGFGHDAYGKDINLDLSNWNVSKISNMTSSFSCLGTNATNININLSGWDISRVTNANSIFSSSGSESNSITIDVTGWNVSNITDLSDLFYNTGIHAKIVKVFGLDNWNTKSCTKMKRMFMYFGSKAEEIYLGNLSKWDTSNVTDMEYMFYYTGNRAISRTNPNVSGWDVSKVTLHNSFNPGATWITPPTWVN